MGAARWVSACLLAFGLTAVAPAQDMEIQFAEPVTISAGLSDAQFEAFGRRFQLTLQPNDRLLKGIPTARKASLENARVLRGTLNGASGSWVRLVINGTRIDGAIWDGSDLYVIAQYDEVAHLLAHSMPAAARQSVVYRMSDALNVLPENFCASEPRVAGESANGLAQFKSLVSELKLQFVAAPTDQLDISLIADSALQQVYSSPNDNLSLTMLNTLNVVDGIYDSQLGLVITASDLRFVPAGSDPFTSDQSNALLDQLRTYRASIPAVQSKPVAHLFTARELDGGSTLGIAAIGGACDARDGVSLTSMGFGGIQSRAALVMAHEIGHNLGAHHDIASCGNTFLMWPVQMSETTPVFSQCSFDEIRPFIAAHRGACLSAPIYGDAEVRIGAISPPVATEPFVWPVFVRSAGTAPLADAIVGLSIQGVTINSAVPTSGACAPLNGEMQCQLGTLAAGVEARVDLNITSNYAQALELRATSNGANDRYESNNFESATTTVQPQARLTTSLDPASRAALVGETVSYTLTLASNGVRTARGVSVTLGGGPYFRTTAATSSRGTCSVSFIAVNCTIGDIATGSSVQVQVEGHATQGVNIAIGANVSSSNALLSPSNVNASLTATATRDLAIDVPTGLRYAVVGSPYDLTFPIRVNGTQAINDGRFRMNTGGITVQSVTIGGVTCDPSDYFAALGGGCPLGNLNPGDQRTVTIRLLFGTKTSTNITVMAETGVDELASNNQVSLPFEARSGIDVSIASRVVDAQLEGQTLHVNADIRSLGTNDAADIVATLDVPTGLRVISATLLQGSCALSGNRRVTCSLAALARNQSAQMSADVVGDQPAMYTGTFTVGALNDGVSTNNTSNSIINVRSLADVSLGTFPEFTALVVGRPVDMTFDVISGPVRPVHNVRITLPAIAPSIVIDALSAPVGACTITASSGYCDLGDLAPNGTVRVSARYRAVSGFTGMAAWVRVEASDNSNSGNDIQSIRIDTYPAGDAGLRIASGTAAGNVAGTLALPRITVNTVARIEGLAIEIPLPAFAGVTQVSLARGICSGTTLLRCELGSRDAGESDDIDITLRLDGPGTFDSQVILKAVNDTNAVNDTGSLQIQANSVVTPPSNPPASGGSASGGGGGGGRIEWLLLALLGAIATRRAMRSRRAL